MAESIGNCQNCGAPIERNHDRECLYCGKEFPRITENGELTAYGRWVERERQKHIGVLETISAHFRGYH